MPRYLEEGEPRKGWRSPAYKLQAKLSQTYASYNKPQFPARGYDRRYDVSEDLELMRKQLQEQARDAAKLFFSYLG